VGRRGLGFADGFLLGFLVSVVVGRSDGNRDGSMDGFTTDEEGASVGDAVGCNCQVSLASLHDTVESNQFKPFNNTPYSTIMIVGLDVFWLGFNVGFLVGREDGFREGRLVGFMEGFLVGFRVGFLVDAGFTIDVEGARVGEAEGGNCQVSLASLHDTVESNQFKPFSKMPYSTTVAVARASCMVVSK
jgi:hypothetical protein